MKKHHALLALSALAAAALSTSAAQAEEDHPRSTKEIGGGAMLMSAGSIMVGTGIYFLATACDSTKGSCEWNSAQTSLAAWLIGPGIVHIIAGLAVTYHGASTPHPSAAVLAKIPNIAIGPRGFAASWAF